MISSLRSRLWLSYALLIGVILCIAAAGLLVALTQDNTLLRQTAAKIQISTSAILTRFEQRENLSDRQLQRLLEAEAERRSERILIYAAAGDLVLDTEAKSAAFRPPLKAPAGASYEVRQARDENQQRWLYTINLMEDGSFLVVAAQPPRFPVWSLLREELAAPLLWAGAAALLVAFLLSLGMARWITAPLQRIARSAQAVAAGSEQPIAAEGPREVRDLANSLNELLQRLRLSQQAQRDLVANVSHELKTPLTSIQGFAQAIQDGTAATPEAVQASASAISDEAARMYRLVLDLLTLARLDAGTDALRLAPVDLGALLRRTADQFQFQAAQAGVELRVEAGSLPPLQGDGDRLIQVLNNLADNAIRHTPAGGNVRLSAAAAAGSVRLVVADTGSGIPLEDQPRIFERFYQVDKSRRGGSGRGSGLGLAIARQIVLAHGGTIKLTSIPGSGSEFVIDLPVNTPIRKPSP
ncbi:MAG TPA: HAMP domain-containing sensor histidine kinase [Anaerolineaceae bacterium]|nr:HAMP domain-containing sensor histidine kinase [Anaerolineaceae bacterium]HPN53027.1 HAMP domain-containing sensor histidine kinase [Anaerolineaceae bacterium]